MDRKNLIPYPAVINIYQDDYTGEMVAVYHREMLCDDISGIATNIPDALRTLADRIAKNAANKV